MAIINLDPLRPDAARAPASSGKFAGLLLFFLKKPGEISVSARAGPRRVITERVMPVDLADRVVALGKRAEEAAEPYLRRLEPSGLKFLGRPLAERKRQIEEALRVLAPEYATLREEVVANLPAIHAAMEAFCEKHPKARRRVITPAWVDTRFVLSWRWLPWQLPDDVRSELFTPDEQAELEAEVTRSARDAEVAVLRRHVGTVVHELGIAGEALSRGSVVNRRSMACLGDALDALAALAAQVPELRGDLESQVEDLRTLFEDLRASRDSYDRVPQGLDDLKTCVAALAERATVLAAAVESPAEADGGDESCVLTEAA